MRIILGFILALSVSFACDQPHEEVGGYKIGCPFDGKNILMSTPLDFSSGTVNVTGYSGFFDTVSITEIDGNIEALMFQRLNSDLDNNVYAKKLLRSLEDKWGEFYEINEGVYRKYPSGSLSEIVIFFPENGVGAVTLIYESKIFTDKKYQYEMKKDKEIESDFSKF